MIQILFLCTCFFGSELSLWSADPQTSSKNNSQNAPEGISDAKLTNRKRLLDAVQKGVVVIETKAHALAQERFFGGDSAWIGSGFIVNREKGLIATNHHVAGELSVCTYEVKFSNGTKIPASLYYFDPIYDFAFLKVDPEKMPKDAICLDFSEETVKINEQIYAMGNSAGDEFSTHEGTVFTIYDNVGPFDEQSFRFSGVTVGGASGSPVFNENGKVVGILYGGRFVSGAALPIRYLSVALGFLLKNEIPPRRTLGVISGYCDIDLVSEIGGISREDLNYYKKTFPESQNKIIKIQTPLVKTKAEKVLQSGDIIWAVNDHLVGPQLQSLDEIVNKSTTVKLEVYRNGQKVVIDQLETTPLHSDNAYNLIFFAGTVWFMDGNAQRLSTGDSKSGVYISGCNQTSPLKELYKGWFSDRPLRITHINNQKIENLSDLEKMIPTLLSKKVFSVRYIDYIGEREFDRTIIADRHPRFSIVKYEGKFDTPRRYTFNKATLEWEIVDLNVGLNQAQKAVELLNSSAKPATH